MRAEAFRGAFVTVDEFIEKWRPSGGNERANTQLFVSDLCSILGVEAPQPTFSEVTRNDYVFERHVIKTEIDGTTSNGWVDCYKRDSFILEAKQGSAADIAAVEGGAGETRRDFFGQTAAERFKRGMARRGTGQWTGAMQRAAGQAEGYAKALPADHGWPPFLLVSDIGYCIDVYADFQRSGKGYAPFPDRRRFRVTLDDLRDPDVRARLAAVWDAPLSLDPSAEAARVTRGIADHLATLAIDIEAREQNPDRVAAFLMRLLFTMFAEDTGLIPKKSFSALLKKTRDRPDLLTAQFTQLWQAMDVGGLAFGLGEAGETVRRFNGYLFKDTTAIELKPNEIDVLVTAADADWRQVEPAIFGTLLEHALNPKDRAKLGAHYTPRAYVERLVGPTIMEPLRDDWAGSRLAATQAAEAGDKETARKLVETFHGKLAQTKVLDPACGTGNFLYVAMARMKELEGEVLELLQELGDDQYLAEISGHTITPENFLGLEINPRAAAIAQLVLWIGYLQWHFRVNGEDRMPEPPVLRDVKTIENRDALLSWDRRELERDQYGRPITRWDGETTKKHPMTGRDIPDESARMEVYRYINPTAAKWPKADFIIGNPPFIGNKRMRELLGSTYVDAIHRVFRDVPNSVDFVMYWWDRAATLVRKRGARQFGLVTTNTITQSQARPVLRRALESIDSIGLSYAIADHPWRDIETDAAVRVSMTVGARDAMTGRLAVVGASAEEGLGHLEEFRGRIGPDLKIGTSTSSTRPLKSNSDLCWQGIKLVGAGFIIQGEAFNRLKQNIFNIPFLRRYWTGRDFTQFPVEKYVIDFTGLDELTAREAAPELYAHLTNYVRPERLQNNDRAFREKWWLFGRPRPDLREANAQLTRYIVTSEVAKHRFFQFLSWPDNLIDGSVIAISLSDAFDLGVLSSKIHITWALSAGGRLEDRPRYQNEVAFDPFPFPDTHDEALKDNVRHVAEKLDELRKIVLARYGDLTMTKLYNTLEALYRAEATDTVLSDKDRDIAERGCVSLIRQYHEAIDDLVADAYGWPRGLTSDRILERLVALNKERAKEEAQGQVRWLRPHFQAPGYKAPVEQAKFALPEVEKVDEIIEWPAALPDQVVAVAQVVERAARPIAANDVARTFKAKNAKGVTPVLDALAGMGRLRKLEDGRYVA